MAASSHCITSLFNLDTKKFSLSSNPSIFFTKSSSNPAKRQSVIFCSLTTNGSRGDSRKPIGIIETRTFPAVSSPESALEALKSAIANIEANPPSSDSGIIWFEVPINEHIEALETYLELGF